MQKTLCRWFEAARRGDMCQEATPGTCVPCLPGEIEPWAECLWVWRNYRLGGRLTCRWHQRRQPEEVEKPAVVIVHKLRRHVFEEFMRWLNCTERISSSSLVSRAHHRREECTARFLSVFVHVCPTKRVHATVLSLCLRPHWICHHAPIMFTEVVFTSPVNARSTLHYVVTSTLLDPRDESWCRVGSRYPDLLCSRVPSQRIARLSSPRSCYVNRVPRSRCFIFWQVCHGWFRVGSFLSSNLDIA